MNRWSQLVFVFSLIVLLVSVLFVSFGSVFVDPAIQTFWWVPFLLVVIVFVIFAAVVNDTFKSHSREVTDLMIQSALDNQSANRRRDFRIYLLSKYGYKLYRGAITRATLRQIAKETVAWQTDQMGDTDIFVHAKRISEAADTFSQFGPTEYDAITASRRMLKLIKEL